MAATNRENAIESENEAPRLDDSKLATGEGRSTVTSTCIQNGAGGLKPQGGSPADVDAEERTAENRRSLRPFFFNYLVYGSADPIFQDLEKNKK